MKDDYGQGERVWWDSVREGGVGGLLFLAFLGWLHWFVVDLGNIEGVNFLELGGWKLAKYFGWGAGIGACGVFWGFSGRVAGWWWSELRVRDVLYMSSQCGAHIQPAKGRNRKHKEHLLRLRSSRYLFAIIFGYGTTPYTPGDLKPHQQLPA